MHSWVLESIMSRNGAITLSDREEGMLLEDVILLASVPVLFLLLISRQLRQWRQYVPNVADAAEPPAAPVVGPVAAAAPAPAPEPVAPPMDTHPHDSDGHTVVQDDGAGVTEERSGTHAPPEQSP